MEVEKHGSGRICAGEGLWLSTTNGPFYIILHYLSDPEQNYSLAPIYLTEELASLNMACRPLACWSSNMHPILTPPFNCKPRIDLMNSWGCLFHDTRTTGFTPPTAHHSLWNVAAELRYYPILSGYIAVILK